MEIDFFNMSFVRYILPPLSVAGSGEPWPLLSTLLHKHTNKILLCGRLQVTSFKFSTLKRPLQPIEILIKRSFQKQHKQHLKFLLGLAVLERVQSQKTMDCKT